MQNRENRVSFPTRKFCHIWYLSAVELNLYNFHINVLCYYWKSFKNKGYSTVYGCMQLLSQYNCDYCHVASLVTICLDFPLYGMYMWELQRQSQD